MRTNNWITKAILTSFALFIASFASAQTATVNVVKATANQGEVDNFVPGVTPYVLQIKATETKTTAYHYSVEATKEDGSTKTITGKVNRTDDKNTGYTVTSVNLGVEPVTVCITISDL